MGDRFVGPVPLELAVTATGDDAAGTADIGSRVVHQAHTVGGKVTHEEHGSNAKRKQRRQERPFGTVRAELSNQFSKNHGMLPVH